MATGSSRRHAPTGSVWTLVSLSSGRFANARSASNRKHRWRRDRQRQQHGQPLPADPGDRRDRAVHGHADEHPRQLPHGDGGIAERLSQQSARSSAAGHDRDLMALIPAQSHRIR